MLSWTTRWTGSVLVSSDVNNGTSIGGSNFSRSEIRSADALCGANSGISPATTATSRFAVIDLRNMVSLQGIGPRVYGQLRQDQRASLRCHQRLPPIVIFCTANWLICQRPDLQRVWCGGAIFPGRVPTNRGAR